MGWATSLAAGIGAAGSIAGGMLGADAAGDAAELQRKSLKKVREDLRPWKYAGRKALRKLWRYIQDPSLVTEMPGYEFALGEGTKALLAARSATGNLQSGATGRELTRYGQDYATTNWLNYLRPYQDLSAAGQNAAAVSGHVSAAMTPEIASNMLAEGGAKVGAVGNVTNAILSGVKDYYYMNELDKLRNLFPQSGKMSSGPPPAGFPQNYLSQF